VRRGVPGAHAGEQLRCERARDHDQIAAVLRPSHLTVDGGDVRPAIGKHQPARPVEHVFQRSLHSHDAPIQDHHVVDDPLDILQDVRGEQHRRAVVAHGRQRRPQDLAAGARVEAEGRIVEDQQVGAMRERKRSLVLRRSPSLIAGNLRVLP